STAIYALGWTSLLTRPALGFTVVAMSAATIAAMLFFPAPARARERAREMLQNARDFVLLPWKAIVETFRAKSFALPALLYSYGVLLYTIWLCWLTPAVGWDALWYHEPITGYAIQNHGFKIVSLPAALEYINGFPRLCEMMNLWFAFFTDRRMN